MKGSSPASESGTAIRAAIGRELGTERMERAPFETPRIPDHKLLHRVGIGAYGEVWMARNTLGTLRAVKIVYRVRFEEERPYQREFHGILKYEPISRTHDGLVQILHVGRNDDVGCFYYVMELADDANLENGRRNAEGLPTSAGAAPGSALPSSQSYRPRTLRSDLRQRTRLAPVNAAQLVLRLAGALEHLHQRGLVHRDIKPSNVIFVGGQPKLADIGLVTGAGDSRSFVGTEGFIPPEGPGTPQADIYSLGKLLYELATGRDRLEFPHLPADAVATPEGDGLLELNEILSRACAPERSERYGTAAELQADLNWFLAGRSLRQTRQAQHHVLWLKRFAAATSLGLLLALASVWFARLEARRARAREQLASERARTETNLRQRAEAAEAQSRQQLYAALVEQARATVRSTELGQRVRALEAIRQAAAIANRPELRREAWAALALSDFRFERDLPLPAGTTLKQLDPAFERVAICRGGGPVEIHSLTDGRVLCRLPASSNLSAYVGLWSPDGKYLAVKRDHSDEDESADLEVWDVAGQSRLLLVSNSAYGAVAFHPRDPAVIVGARKGEVVSWRLAGVQETDRFHLRETPNILSFSPADDSFAAAYSLAGEWMVEVWRKGEGQPMAAHRFRDRVAYLSCDPNGRWIAVADHGGSVHLMDPRNGAVITLGKHKAQAVQAVFSPDGEYLISGGWERELICWDLGKMQRAFALGVGAWEAQFSANGRQFAVLTLASVQLHAFEQPTSHREFPEDLGGRVLRYADFSADGHWLAVSGEERLAVWDWQNSGSAALLSQGADSRVSFAGGGGLFASGETNCLAWRLSPGTNRWAPPNLEAINLPAEPGFTCLCLAGNDAVITGSRGSQVVSLPDFSERRSARTIAGINRASRDGRWLGVFAPFTPWLHVYRLPTLEPVAVLTNRANIFGFEFPGSGQEVAVTSPAGIEFWSTVDWQRTRIITNFMGIIFPPAGQAWWLTQDYRHAGLYDSRTLELLLPLPTGMLPLALSPDGKFLAVSVDARRVQVWDLEQVRQQLRDLGIDWQDP